jgi:DNA-binding PadR family transcriptional regulator
MHSCIRDSIASFWRRKNPEWSSRTNNMGTSKSRIQNRILLLIEQGASYGYEIIRQLGNDYGDIRLNTLYRWLYDMEAHNLLESSVRPGPFGPNRRVYNLAPLGKRLIRNLLRESLELVMNYFDDYLRDRPDNILGFLEDLDSSDLNPRILISGFPRIRRSDIGLFKSLVSRNDKTRIDIIGSTVELGNLDIGFRRLDGDICSIPVRRGRYNEIWFSRTPSLEVLDSASIECKRVLTVGGKLRIIASNLYFNEPLYASMSEFLRMTATHLFPDFGVIEGNSICGILRRAFDNCRVYEVPSGVTIVESVKQ